MSKLDKKFWQKYFIVYDYLNYLIPYNNLINKIIDHLKINVGDLVLDAGSGTGNISIKLSKLKATVFSIDYSVEGTELHKEKSPMAIVHVLDLTKKLPFEDNYFDKICSNNVIYTLNVSDRITVFSEFNRVLKPGGIIVVSNLIEGFKPINIYLQHLNESIKSIGISKTLFMVIKLVLPTLKIFYYNHIIQKTLNSGPATFMKIDEQRQLLLDSKFVRVSDNIYVYADQAILNFAYKA